MPESEFGFPDCFIRMWNYDLSDCEAAFDERFTGVVQIQFDKPRRVRAVSSNSRDKSRQGLGRTRMTVPNSLPCAL